MQLVPKNNYLSFIYRLLKPYFGIRPKHADKSLYEIFKWISEFPWDLITHILSFDDRFVCHPITHVIRFIQHIDPSDIRYREMRYIPQKWMNYKGVYCVRIPIPIPRYSKSILKNLYIDYDADDEKVKYRVVKNEFNIMPIFFESVNPFSFQ